MSSWGVGISFSKLPYVRVFLKNRAKSVGFQVVIWNQNFEVLILFAWVDFIAVGGAAAVNYALELSTKPLHYSLRGPALSP